MPNAVYERVVALYVPINPSNYRFENINKIVILESRQSRVLGMNRIENVKLLSLHCVYFQRCTLCGKLLRNNFRAYL